MIAQAIEETSLEAAYTWEGIGVRANMIVTLDGAVSGRDGTSGSIGTPTDRAVFSQLRRTADVVLVGAGTFRAEQYRPITSGPALCVVSRKLDLDPENRAFQDGTREAFVLTCDDSPTDRRSALSRVATVIVAGDREVDLASGIAQLRSAEGVKLLCEGGPQLLKQMLTRELIDELCLTISAQTSGMPDAKRLLGEAPIPLQWTFTHVLWDGDGVYARLTPSR